MPTGWRAIFWINIPIGLAAAVLAALFVPESKAPRPRRIDPVGQLLMIVTLGALTYAIIKAPQVGWTSGQTAATALIAAAGCVALVASGSAVLLAALALAGLSARTPLWWILASYVVFGLGFGLVNTPITNSAVSGMPNSQAGVAAAVTSTSRQVGGALGVAVAGSVLNSGLHGPMSTPFSAASHPAWLAMAACGALIVPIGFVITGRWARRTVARTAALFDDGSFAPAMPGA
ncbi:MAG: hypothetical protein ACRDNT_04065 [Streptosporangiaceae bacterium]